MSKTIFYYGIDNNYGGMERYAFNLINGITQKNCDIQFHILTIFDDFAYKNELVQNCGCSYTVLPNPRRHPFQYHSQLKKIMKQNKDSVFHINLMSYKNVLLLSALKSSKAKAVICGHSTKAKRFKLLHKLSRRFFSNLGTKVALNKETATFMYGKNNNATIIGNAVNFSDFYFSEEERTNTRKQLNINNDTLLVGQIGRICKEKNQSFTIHLAKSLGEKSPYHFLIIGKQMDQNQIKNAVHSDNIVIMDEITNVRPFLNAMDVLLMPSLFEGQSLVVLEALAAGLFIISSDQVAQMPNIQNIKYLPLNQKDWADELSKHNPDMKRTNVLVGTPYDLNIWIDKYLNIYKKLIS